MKIAQIVASLESRHGGPSRSVRGLSVALASLGHSVELLTTAPQAEGPDIAGGLTVQTFLRQWPAAASPSRPMRDHLNASSPEVIHNHGLWLRPLHYARQTAQRLRVPLVISPRGMMAPWAWRHRRVRKALASALIHPGALHAAVGWHATCEAEAEDIRRLGVTQPICVAPNGVTAPTPAAIAEAWEYWVRQRPDIKGRPTGLFYSRFHSMKRVIETIDLWLEVAPPEWRLLVVGIPEEYSVEDLRDYTHRNGGSNRVAVFDGAGRPPPYPAAELLLLPSHSENFGLVVAEALVHGLPALTTDTTPWQALEANGAGHCVPWADFGRALRELLAEGPDKLRARGAAAREWATKEFAWEKSAATLATFYKGLRLPAP